MEIPVTRESSLSEPVGYLTLKDKATPFQQRHKIARFLWKSSRAPNKEQILISWIVSEIVSGASENHDEGHLLWKTLADFLCSNELSLFFCNHQKAIDLKNFAEVYFKTLLSQHHCFPDLLVIGKCLSFNDRLSNEFKFSFQAVCRLTSTWLASLQEWYALKKKNEGDTTLCDIIVFIEQLFRKIIKVMKQQNVKRGFFNIVEHCLIPMLNIHSELSKEDHNALSAEESNLREAIHDIIKETLFSRFNFEFVVKKFSLCDIKQIDTEEKHQSESTKSIKMKKLDDQSYHFWTKINMFISSHEENIFTLGLLYRFLCNSATNIPQRKKFQFFSNLIGLLDVEKEHHLELLNSLLKLNLSTKFYRPSSNESLAHEQHDLYCKLVNILMTSRCSRRWSNCLISISKVNHLSMKPAFRDIMNKLHGCLMDADLLDLNWIEELFDDLHQNFNRNKQPLALLKLFVEWLVDNCHHHDTCPCSLVCSLFGRSMALQSDILPFHNTHLSIWECIQDEVLKRLPITLQVHEEDDHVTSGETVGSKRKLKCNGTVISKKVKQESTKSSVLQYLFILLNRFLENLKILEIHAEIFCRSKLLTLLQNLYTVVKELRHYVLTVDSSLSGQYYQLATTIGYLEVIMKKYQLDQTESWFDVEMLSEREVPVELTSLQTRYYYMVWKCFQIESLTSTVMKNQHCEKVLVYRKMIQELIMEFLNSIRPLPAGGSWNGMVESIRAQDELKLAILDLLKRFFHILLFHCDDENMEVVANLLVSCDAKLEQNGLITVSSLTRDMLTSSSFAECRRLQVAIIKSCATHLMKVSQGTKILKHFIAVTKLAESLPSPVNNRDLSEVAKHLTALFSIRKFSQQKIKEAAIRIVDLLNHLPTHWLTTAEKHTTLALIMFCIPFAKSNLQLQEKCIFTMDLLVASREDKNLAILSPHRVLIEYFSIHFPSYSLKSQASVRRILQMILKSKIRNHISIEDFTDSVVESFSLDLSCCILQVCILFRSVSSSMQQLSQVKVASEYSLITPEEITVENDGFMSHYFTERRHLKLIRPASKKKSDHSDEKEALKACVMSLEKLLPMVLNCWQAIISLPETTLKYELYASCLLASYIVDTLKHERALREKLFLDNNMKAVLKESIANLKFESNPKMFASKLLLLLLHCDLIWTNATSANDGDSKLENDVITSDDIIKDLLPAYVSPAVQQYIACRALMDRLLVICLSLLPSPSKLQEVLVSVLAIIKTSTVNEDVLGSLLFSRLLSSCFDKKTFFNIKSSIALRSTDDRDKHASIMRSSQTKFLRHAVDDVVCLIDRVTSHDIDQSDVWTLTEGFLTLADILSIGSDILKFREVSMVFPAISQVPLDEIMTNYFPSFYDIFFSVYKVLNSVIVSNKDAVPGLVPLILSSLRKLLKATLFVGRQNTKFASLKKSKSEYVKVAIDCAAHVESLCDYVSSHYGPYFKMCVSYLIADYVSGLCTHAIYPSVRKPLQNAMYHLVSLCVKEDIAMLTTTLPLGVKELFKNFYSDFVKYFKYTGRV